MTPLIGKLDYMRASKAGASIRLTCPMYDASN